MRSRRWLAGAHIVRSAPWSALLVSTGAAAVLLVVAGIAHRDGIALVTALLGLSACGGSAAYVLDEDASAVMDATPTSRGRRVAWRIPVVIMPAATAAAGLLALNRLDPSTHWLRLIPLAAGAIAMGVGIAAALRRTGAATPGDQAAVLALAANLLIVASDPLRRWVTVVPLGDAAHPGRSVLLWVLVTAICGAVIVTSSQDPARSQSSGHRRGSHHHGGTTL